MTYRVIRGILVSVRRIKALNSASTKESKMYFPQPHVLSGFEWLGNRIKAIRLQSLEGGRKIKHIRIQKGTYGLLWKNFVRYSPFGHDQKSQITIYGIPLVAHDFDNPMMVEPVWTWQTLQGIY